MPDAPAPAEVAVSPPPPLSPKSAQLAASLAAFEAASGRGADPVTAATDGNVDHAPLEPPTEPEGVAKKN